MSLRRGAAAGGLTALLLAACVRFDVEERAREHARAVLRCPEARVAELGERVFEASGCGRTIGIACSSHNEPRCSAVRLAGRLADERPTAGRLTGERSTAGGDSSGTESSGTGPGTGPSSGPAGGGESAVETRASWTGDRRSDDPEAEAALRAALDARRDDVLACVGRDRAVVRAAWGAAGDLAIALTGELAGTPEERCVRAALADVRAPAAGRLRGAVLHLLRASNPRAE
jgi:hypothetical protein